MLLTKGQMNALPASGTLTLVDSLGSWDWEQHTYSCLRDEGQPVDEWTFTERKLAPSCAYLGHSHKHTDSSRQMDSSRCVWAFFFLHIIHLAKPPGEPRSSC